MLQVGSYIRKSGALATILLAVILLATCNGKSPVQEFFGDEDEPETVFVDTDDTDDSSEAEETDDEFEEREAASPAPVPDTSFDNFAYAFDENRSLQATRVDFPLPVEDVNGEEHTITRAQWQHRNVFMHQDFITVLWTSEKQMLDFQQADTNQVCVDQIYLHSREMHTYHFSRNDDGQWMLERITTDNFDNSELSSFLDFYRQFATDSIYQRHHLASQLRYTTEDEEGDEPIVGTIDADQWFEFAPEMPEDVITNIRYGQHYGTPNRIVMQMRSFGEAMQSVLTFQRRAGQWRLTDVEN